MAIWPCEVPAADSCQWFCLPLVARAGALRCWPWILDMAMTWQTVTGHPQFPTSSRADGLIPRYDTRWHPCRAGSGCKWHTTICWCSGVCSAGSGCDGYRYGMGAGSIAIFKLFKRRFGCFLWFMLACQVLFFLFSVSWYVWAEDLPYLACSQMLRVYQSLQVWNLDVHTANTVYIMYAICICDHMRVFVPGAPQALVEPARRGWTPVCCFFFLHQQL